MCASKKRHSQKAGVHVETRNDITSILKVGFSLVCSIMNRVTTIFYSTANILLGKSTHLSNARF